MRSKIRTSYVSNYTFSNSYIDLIEPTGLKLEKKKIINWRCSCIRDWFFFQAFTREKLFGPKVIVDSLQMQYKLLNWLVSWMSVKLCNFRNTIVHFDADAEGDYLAHVTFFARAKRVSVPVSNRILYHESRIIILKLWFWG